jgi:acetylornithine deacetylase/succinyl-diaminopimelate desuccinylase-like protein
LTTAHEYATANGNRFVEQLLELIRIPSVSTDPAHKDDVRQAAEWVGGKMRQAGVQHVEVMPTAGHPVVYGDWLNAGPNAPTVLIYGHYDVQPAVMADGWHSEPFEPVQRDGKIYARGSSDDKGQMFIHIKAIESRLATEGKLPVNVKFLIEGEEEIGSAHLGDFVRSQREKLKADVCVISDTGMREPDEPAICYSLRGLTTIELRVSGPSHDLHSGGYGGSVHNPLQALAEIIAQLHNPDGSVNVPGFYDDVVPLTDEERAELVKGGLTEAAWKEATGASQSWGEAGYTITERLGARPTLEINGMGGGFQGEGFKTVLPAKAMAKISCRLVANQDPARIFDLVQKRIAAVTPPGIKSEIINLGGGPAAMVELTSPAMQAAVRAYEKGWGVRPVFIRGGGSIPIVADLQHQLNVPVLLMGYGLDDDGAHGPDEHFVIEMFHKGIATAIYFLDEIAQR